MKILFYRYGSICEPDLIASFKELGNQIITIDSEIEKKDITPSEQLKLVSFQLERYSFDFVFTINYFPVISDVCNIFKIRYICWVVDCPVIELYSNTIKNPWNRIFLFDLAQYRYFSPQNPSCIFYLPLATNVKRWEMVINSSSIEERTRFRSEISFVGSLYTEKCYYQNFRSPSDYLTGYLDALMDAQSKVYGAYFLDEVLPDSLVDTFCSNCTDFYIPEDSFIDDRRAIMCQLYLDSKITSLERTRMLSALGKHHHIDLYTASDTSNLPVCNKGRAKTLSEMPLIFHESKINLNMTAKSIREGLSLRIWDILGCGGFLLTNYQSEIEHYFSIDNDLVVYTSEADLLEKTEYYLSHEKERSEIAYNGYQKVKLYHNYPERVLDMLTHAFQPKKALSSNSPIGGDTL